MEIPCHIDDFKWRQRQKKKMCVEKEIKLAPDSTHKIPLLKIAWSG